MPGPPQKLLTEVVEGLRSCFKDEETEAANLLRHRGAGVPAAASGAALAVPTPAGWPMASGLLGIQEAG